MMSTATDIRGNVPLAPLSTIGLGGPARFLATCTSADECRAAVEFGRSHALPLHILGGGSNTVFADAGYPGLVIHVAISGVSMAPDRRGVVVRIGAGESWDDVVTACVARGLGGVECLAGIPGSAGATPIQNVGAYGQEVGETITAVTALDLSSLREVTFTTPECMFGYRSSRFKTADHGRFLITGIELTLTPDARPGIRYPELAAAVAAEGPLDDLAAGQPVLSRVRKTVLRLRRSKGMVLDPNDPESRSVGSFFMNPVVPPAAATAAQERWRAAGHEGVIPAYPAPDGVKLSAAWLVEHAGFPRGTERARVGISRKHPLALVNRGGTTAELLALATEVRDAVAHAFGITLTIEPVIVPPELRP